MGEAEIHGEQAGTSKWATALGLNFHAWAFDVEASSFCHSEFGVESRSY